jgi:hypothetical protein
MSRAIIRMKNLAAGIVGGLMLMAAQPALAWDGYVQGTIYAISVTAGANFGFRVYLNGVTSTCTGGENWSYLNESDSNYKTYVAALMMAKSQGSTVHIYTYMESGYCHIGHITVA